MSVIYGCNSFVEKYVTLYETSRTIIWLGRE